MFLLFNFSFSIMFCFALFPLVSCDLSSSHKLFPLAALGTLFLESWGSSWRIFGDTQVPDPLMSQYVTAHRVSPIDGAFIRWDTFHVTISHFGFYLITFTALLLKTLSM